MVSDREQTTPNPFLNSMGFLQGYLINYIEAITGFCDNAIRANEYCVKAFWEPWLRPEGSMVKGGSKVEKVVKERKDLEKEMLKPITKVKSKEDKELQEQEVESTGGGMGAGGG